MRKLAMIILGVSCVTFAPTARGGDEKGADKKFLGIESCKKDEFDCVWVSPDFTFKDKTIHVQKWSKEPAEAPKGDDYGDLKWKTCEEFMQRVFAEETEDRLKSTKFVTGGSGDLRMEGQITEFRYPKKGAAWGGWIGQAAGSGAISYDWKIVDKSGKTLVAVHHRILAGASDTMDRRVRAVHNDELIEFVKKHAK